MTKLSESLGICGLVLLLGSCSSSPKRGVVAMKLSDTEAHVGIGKNEITVGDHLELFRNICTGSKGDRSCQKKPFGHGEVTAILNQDYSVVKFPAGTQFVEGDMLEKHAH